MYLRYNYFISYILLLLFIPHDHNEFNDYNERCIGQKERKKAKNSSGCLHVIFRAVWVVLFRF